jgi:putative transcriptional regulator
MGAPYDRNVSLRTIEPGLLLAAPRLGDSNFEGRVVLLGLHDSDDGSLGWIVNGKVIENAGTIVRATGIVGADEALPSSFDRPAHGGGPVSLESVWILHRRGEGESLLPGSIAIGQDIGVSATEEALKLLIQGKGPTDFRLLVGYAGWGPGQLERELAAGAWLPAAATVGLLFEGDLSTLWRRAYAEAIGTVPEAFVSTTRGSA